MPRIPDNELLLPTSSYLLVTVGTTKFERLIEQIDTGALWLLQLCVKLKIKEIILQIGTSTIEPKQLDLLSTTFSTTHKIKIIWVNYATNFQSFLQNASLVISHAGAGSILETLRATPQEGLTAPRLFVVINEQLMDNHQEELAEAFAMNNYLYYSKCDNCIDNLIQCNWDNIKPYPQPNTNGVLSVIAHTVYANLNYGEIIPIDNNNDDKDD